MSRSFLRSIASVSAENKAESESSASTRFAFKLFRELIRSDASPNVFFSPASVMMCLAVVHELASGQTREDMAGVLELAGLDQVDVEKQIASMKAAFLPRADARMALANGLFLATHAQISPSVRDKLKTLYSAELATLDFSSSSAAEVVNAWVNAKTKGKIGKIVEHLSELTALAVLNAVHFNGLWEEPFRKRLTQDRPFRTLSGAIKPVPLMVQRETYTYYEDRKVQLVALPYRGNLSMYIVLPESDADLARFRQELTSELWGSWLGKSKPMLGMIQVPRFKIEYEAELNGPLAQLGMRRAFDSEHAEFDNVHTDRPPIWLDQVAHKAVVEVDEEGTEAAAATMSVVFAGASLNQTEPKQFVMIVDHPFMVVIRDESTKTILFMGWIGDPQ